MNTLNLRTGLIWGLIALWLFGSGCAASKMMAPSLKPLQLAAPSVNRDHFKRDKSGSISEAALQKLLQAPVFLEDEARIGVVQVSSRYRPDEDLPTVPVPHVLTDALEGSGLFQVATEVSTDWPIDSGIAGLRELAARYRSEYLLLYRHRFVDRTYINSLGWLYLTVVGIFTLPAQTVEASGVLEATLFDVKTGTILFTVFQRVKDSRDENIWNNDRKLRELKLSMMKKAADALADQTLTKLRLLAACRPEPRKHREPVARLYDNKPIGP